MATSGTVGNTVINTAKLLEKAIRRCGLSPQALTPETVETAREDLFMLLLSLSNRGLNLWCIDKKLLALNVGQGTYTLPVGTQSILNAMISTHTRVTGTDTSGVDNYTTTLSEAAGVVRAGVKFSALPTGVVEYQTSADGVTWVTKETIATTDYPALNEWYWFDVNQVTAVAYHRLFATSVGVVTDFYLSTNNKEIALTPFNRDDYANQPNKTFQSNNLTNYYFEKLVDPKVTYWPIPNDDTRCVVLFRYRQIQDIGLLTDELELPSRWYESISWHLSARLAFELPGIDPARRAEVLQMSQSMTIEVEAGETDNSPTFFAPRISVYTR